MNPIFGTKGQTALEYLLIVVVAIVVVVAVMIWMQSTSGTAIQQGSGTVNEAMCRSATCTNNANCSSAKVPACGASGGSCQGNSSVAGNPVPGHCVP